MKAPLCVLICSMLLVGCLQSDVALTDAGTDSRFNDAMAAPDVWGASPPIEVSDPDAGPIDVGVDATGDAGPDTAQPDVGVCPPIGIGATDIPPNPGYVGDTEAECMGMNAPECMGCHVQGGATVLWPVDTPAHPPGVTGPDPRECGVFLGALPPDVACCMGLTSHACAGCHTAKGEVFASPWWEVPAPPDGVDIEARSAEDCFERFGL